MLRILLISIVSVWSVQAQIKIPALSPASKTSQTIGLTQIDIEYSRPSKRDRILFGTEGLLPPTEFWRTGANTATKITISDQIQIMDKILPKGTYTILTKPAPDSWSIYIYKYESSNWSSYTKVEPYVSFSIKPKTTKESIETFLIYFDQISLESAQLVIAWDITRILIPIQVEVHDKTMSNIKKALSGPSNFDYFQAALYLHETQKDLDTALIYIQKATSSKNPLFFQVYREALILADLGRTKEAVEIAKKSLELSKKASNNDFIRLNQKFIQKWSR